MDKAQPPSPVAAPAAAHTAPHAAGHASPTSPDHRQRLLDALAEVLATRSLADTTIADIVAAARVSKRTFYEQFASKEACLLALGEHLNDQTLALIAAHYRFDEDWVTQLRSVMHAFLSSLEAQPAVMRAVYIDMLTIGAEGQALRRRVGERFGQFLILQVEIFRAMEPRKRPLTPALATAVVGGINELILQAIENGQAAQLSQLTPTATEFVQAVLSSLDPPPEPSA